ncbi:MAG: carboxypeptidase regulatory-like domain-containing protein [Actinomycetota bacterium]|nr:carboxypeptidase regulatory-like domain-containing protein [Actinomycetota bacterium]
MIRYSEKRRRRAGASTAAIALIITGLLLILGAPEAMAHGVAISYTTSEGIEIAACYDNGEPMSEAQVTVYAPGEPSDPWLTGTCDEEGKFFFVPDTELPGTWEVKVRQAGHGDIISIEVEEGAVESGGSTGFTWLQKAIMSLAVLWGLAGTALYFRRRKTDAHS